jgi:AcrR family transcriptional regulator
MERSSREPAAASGRASRQARASPGGGPTPRTNDPARTMAGILAVARREFAEKGLSGARIDEIAAATQTSKRMIYYYFGNKEGLYLRVLEDAYQRVRETEAALRLDDLDPVEALRRLVIFTFDHHRSNEDYIRLVMTENMERGAYLKQSKTIRKLNVPAIDAVSRIYARGLAKGLFRPGLNPVDIHASISALAFFNVSNRHTFGLIYQYDTHAPKVTQARRDNVVDMVLRFVCV